MALQSLKEALRNSSLNNILKILEQILEEEPFIEIKEAIEKNTENGRNEENRLINKEVEDLVTILKSNEKALDLFDKISSLASPKNSTDTEEALNCLCASNKEILRKLSKENSYDKIIELFLEEREIFTSLIYMMLTTKSTDKTCHERNDVKIPEGFNDETIENYLPKLKEAISNISIAEGKKGTCEGEFFKCNDEFWIVINIEDAIQTQRVEKGGSFKSESFIPEKCLIFILNPRTGHLKICINKGALKEKQILEAFCDIMLNESIDAFPPKNHVYNLQESYLKVLKEKSLNYTLKKPVNDIFINKIKLSKGGYRFFKTPELKVKDERESSEVDDIYENLEDEGLTNYSESKNRMEGENWEAEKINFTAFYHDNFLGKIQIKKFSIDSKGRVNLNNNKVGLILREILKENGL